MPLPTFLLWLLAAIALAPVAGLLIQVVGAFLDRLRFPAPGLLVQVGGHKQHIVFSGTRVTGQPLVVFESGIAGSSVSWHYVQHLTSEFAHVAAYDRAGFGWSSEATTPRTVKQIIHELFSLLDQVDPGRPLILVGHSFGGMCALYGACAHPDRVAGLVLVDPLHPAEWVLPEPGQKRGLEGGSRLAERVAILARWGVIRAILRIFTLAPGLIPARIADQVSGRGQGALGRLLGEIRKLPRSLWPVVRSHWCLERSFWGIADHIRNLPLSSAQTANAMRPLSIPLIVLTAGREEVRRDAHRLLAELSPRGELRVATQSGHWIQLDEPEQVVQAVRQILRELGWEN